MKFFTEKFGMSITHAVTVAACEKQHGGGPTWPGQVGMHEKFVSNYLNASVPQPTCGGRVVMLLSSTKTRTRQDA